MDAYAIIINLFEFGLAHELLCYFVTQTWIVWKSFGFIKTVWLDQENWISFTMDFLYTLQTFIGLDICLLD